MKNCERIGRGIAEAVQETQSRSIYFRVLPEQLVLKSVLWMVLSSQIVKPVFNKIIDISGEFGIDRRELEQAIQFVPLSNRGCERNVGLFML